MNLLSHKVDDLANDREAIRRGRYGMIEVASGRLQAVYLRPLPKLVSIFDVLVSGRLYHRLCSADRAFFFYNQPRRHSNYLSLTYVLSGRGCTLATLHEGLRTLDQVAEIKGSDALLCDAWNWRISQRLLARAGWEPHLKSRLHRHYIRRFYGAYPGARAATSEVHSSAIVQHEMALSLA